MMAVKNQIEERQPFGEWLKQRRRWCDLTQRDLAVAVDCSPETIRKVEAGRLLPSKALAARLAQALKVPEPECRALIDFARGRLKDAPLEPTSAGVSNNLPALIHFHPLPGPTSPLVGRKDEIAKVSGLLLSQEVRLLTLFGPPGVGKTVLAIHTANQVAHAFPFPAGVCFVDLTSIHESTLVLPTIASALGIREPGAKDLFEILIDRLQELPALLVLDNFEQVNAAAASVAHLVANTKNIIILVTSRTKLHVNGEQAFRVAPLPRPELGHHITAQMLANAPAVTLFIQRARAANLELQLDDMQIRIIAEICIRLDGLPLAIELAAARTNLLSPAMLLEQMNHQLDLLTNGAIDGAGHHQALREAIRWSYQLLDPASQRLFRRLSVFVGGWDLEAAWEVCCEHGWDGEAPRIKPSYPVDFLNQMAGLVDHSLVQHTPSSEGKTRFTMLESLRLFAEEQLDASGEAAELRHRHANYFQAWSEGLLTWLQTPPQAAIDALEAEHENCLAALTWTLTESEDQTQGARIALALSPYWMVRGYLSEGRQWLEAGLNRLAGQPSILAARALARAAELAQLQDDYSQAIQWAEASRGIAGELGDTGAFALAQIPLGWSAFLRNNPTEARQRFEEGLRLFRSLESPAYTYTTRMLHDLAYLAMARGDTVQAQLYYEEELALSRNYSYQLGMFWALHGMGWAAERREDWAQAAAFYTQCLVLARGIQHTDGIALALSGLGTVARSEGKYVQALAYYQECERIWQQLGRKASRALVLQEQGDVALHQGAIERAAAFFTESLILAEELGRARSIAPSLVGLASVACASGQYETAVQLLAAVTVLLSSSNLVLEPMDRTNYEKSIAEAQSYLTPVLFQQAWETGQSLPLTQVIAAAYMLTVPIAVTGYSGRSPSHPEDLTEREVEVLRLVAQGLTNAQIAAKLVVSTRTVSAHLSNVYRKLNISSRAAATRFVVEHGLV